MKINTHRFARLAGVAVLAASVTLTGCDIDELLEVTDPDTVNPGTLNNPATLPIQVNGAYSEFVSAYAGGESYVSTSALMSDEFFSSGTFTTRTQTDRRNQFIPVDGNTTDGIYVALHQARYALGEAAAAVAEFESTADPRYAEMKALEGFTLVTLGEGYCSAVPISGIAEDGTFEYGSPQSSASVAQTGIGLLDEAIGAGGGSLPAVVKGRALINLGQYPAAAAAVASVPTDFTYFAAHSEEGISNGIYGLQDNGRYSISNEEGNNGLPYREDMDPRVPWFQDPADPGGFDDNYPLYKSLRYQGFTSPLVMASGVEARLIEAEAALNAGTITGSGGMITILNDLRADVVDLMTGLTGGVYTPDSGLAPLTDPGTADARLDLLMKERAYWLQLTGHRLGDLRRLVANYGRSASDVYPNGAYHKGGEYGDDVVFPIDFDEANNPNFSHDACNADRPARQQRRVVVWRCAVSDGPGLSPLGRGRRRG